MTRTLPPLRSGAFVHDDAAFRAVVGSTPALTKVVDVDAHEGPTYVPEEDALYITTVPRIGQGGAPRAQVKRIALNGDRFPVGPGRIDVVDTGAVMPNGMTLAHDGTLLVCDQGDHRHDARLIRHDPRTGRSAVVVAEWAGLPLNSPNDVAVHPDGSVWFTDPCYGHLQGFRPRPTTGDFVYRLDPGSTTPIVMVDSSDKPNGIAFSPDGRVLYLADSGANQEPGSFYDDRPHHVYAFDVVDTHRVGRKRQLDVTTPGCPDGVTVDEAGRVYISCATGIRVVSPGGSLLGRIKLPGAVNFTFGGRDNNHLYVTTDTAVWVAVLNTKGA